MNELTAANPAASLAIFTCVWRGGAVASVALRAGHLLGEALECAGSQRGKPDGRGHGKNSDGALAGGEISGGGKASGNSQPRLSRRGRDQR